MMRWQKLAFRSVKDRSRRGVALLLTLIFMVLLTSLALAMSYDTSNSLLMTESQEHVYKARVAAESGLDFMVMHLEPSKYEFTGNPTQANLPSLMAASLPDWMNASLNGSVVEIPTQAFDSHNFSVKLTFPADNRVKVAVTGEYSGTTRTVSMEYNVESRNDSVSWSHVFPHGIMSKSPLNITGSADLYSEGTIDVGGDIMVSVDEAHPEYPALTITGSSSIAGDAYASGDYGDIILGNAASIAGEKNGNPDPRLDHVHEYCNPPVFPQLQPTEIQTMIDLATTPYTASGDSTIYLDNVYIPANTNPTISNSNIVIRGVLYIEQPNDVTFSGQSTVQGVIVSDPTISEGAGTITFTGSSDYLSPATLPDEPQFELVKTISHGVMYIPGFDMTITGNTDITVGGPVFASGINFTGSGELAVKGGIVVGSENMELSNVTGSIVVSVYSDDEDNDIWGIDDSDAKINNLNANENTYTEE